MAWDNSRDLVAQATLLVADDALGSASRADLYPNCGPCRESFPRLQKLAQKYKGKGVVVIAINGMEGQQAFVLPKLRSKGYDFIPLRGNQQWALDAYHVQAFPSTFLIGKDGRMYFRPHLYDDSEERATGLEIDELLSHSGH